MTMPQTVMVMPSPIYEMEQRESFYEKVTLNSELNEEEEMPLEATQIDYGNW